MIGFHFREASVLPEGAIPVSYAVAMGAGAVGSLVFGRLLDKLGQRVIVSVFFMSALFASCVFLGGSIVAFAGMILWGLSMGAQDSLLKAVLALVVLFDTVFGIAWFLGSAAMGLIYEMSTFALVLFSVLLQMAALPLFFMGNRYATTR